MNCRNHPNDSGEEGSDFGLVCHKDPYDLYREGIACMAIIDALGIEVETRQLPNGQVVIASRVEE